VKVFEKEIKRKGKPALKSAGPSRRDSKAIAIHVRVCSDVIYPQTA